MDSLMLRKIFVLCVLQGTDLIIVVPTLVLIVLKNILKRTVQRVKIIPITLKLANEYVSQYHRHHKPCVGCKFCIGCKDGEQFVGVAICGRPVSRHYDNGTTLEINRLCTNGTRNACSKLYGACVRIAREMGYTKVITYILASEDGASLKASNFICEGEAGGTIWTGARKRDNGVPQEMKQRYVYYCEKDGDSNG